MNIGNSALTIKYVGFNNKFRKERGNKQQLNEFFFVAVTFTTFISASITMLADALLPHFTLKPRNVI